MTVKSGDPLKTRKTALITGATSGIGACYASHFAKGGCDLILTGRRMEKLKRAGKTLADTCNVRVETVKAELSDPGDIDKVVRLIRSSDDIEILVNNAGLGNLESFGGEEMEKQMRMIYVHDVASSKFIHAVLPGMKKRKTGTIINVASMAAYAPSAVDVLYAASKAFLVVLSEGLHMELKNSGIRIQALCPGFTRTEFHTRLGMKKGNLKDQLVFRWLSPEAVVNASIKQLRTNRPVCIPGFWYKALYFLIRILPRQLYYSIAADKKAES